ncbi:MAG TPA: signal peptide peptidase SppA [Verrucomicrobiae bacterium]|nr:signal peptide peptidase SppA [Verrucomicrobiae bacterium]
MAEKRNLIVGLVILFLFLGIGLLAALAYLSSGAGYSETEDGVFAIGAKVAIVDVTGIISSSSEVVRQLKKYADDGSVKSIVLRIESPGGGVSASQEIYDAVLEAKGKKAVVASMGSVAASGGYYIACAADTIMANPGSLTGSIGVIAEFPVFGELFKKIGIKTEVIKSGELKDAGSPTRPMTEKERAMIQSVINDTYDQFVEAVVKNRKMEREKVLSLADGSVFTGRQAQANGLIDVLGNQEDAIRLAGKMGGISGEPRTVKEKKYRRRTIFDFAAEEMFGKGMELPEEWKDLLSPGLKYLYKM